MSRSVLYGSMPYPHQRVTTRLAQRLDFGIPTRVSEALDRDEKGEPRWRSMDGRVLTLSQMENGHLVNAMRCVERSNSASFKAKWLPHFKFERLRRQFLSTLVRKEKSVSEFTFEKANRLLDVPRALREAPLEQQERFTMDTWSWGVNQVSTRGMPKDWCGTPACALGHYAARPDLQDYCKLEGAFNSILFKGANGEFSPTGLTLHAGLAHWFGITDQEMQDLFDGDGCDDAKTAIEAAGYIERFVLNKFKTTLDVEEVMAALRPGAEGLHVVLQDYSRLVTRVFNHAFIQPAKVTAVKAKKKASKRKPVLKRAAKKAANKSARR